MSLHDSWVGQKYYVNKIFDAFLLLRFELSNKEK